MKKERCDASAGPADDEPLCDPDEPLRGYDPALIRRGARGKCAAGCAQGTNAP